MFSFCKLWCWFSTVKVKWQKEGVSSQGVLCPNWLWVYANGPQWWSLLKNFTLLFFIYIQSSLKSKWSRGWWSEKWNPCMKQNGNPAPILERTRLVPICWTFSVACLPVRFKSMWRQRMSQFSVLHMNMKEKAVDQNLLHEICGPCPYERYVHGYGRCPVWCVLWSHQICVSHCMVWNWNTHRVAFLDSHDVMLSQI